MIARLAVLQQLLLAHKLLATDLTGIRLTLAVHKVMDIAILGSAELFAADLATVVFGARVAQQMLLQANGITECGLALLAMQIAQFRMHRFDMVVQQTLPLEAAQAYVALEAGPVQVGRVHVGAIIGTLGEARLAEVTLIGSFAGVNALVFHQLDASIAYLIAVRAGEHSSL